MKLQSRLSKIIHLVLILAAMSMLAACAATPAVANPVAPVEGSAPVDTAAEPPAQEPEVIYNEFTLPGPEEVSFQLPEGWNFWGNAGYLSLDDGKTLAGVRFTFADAGENPEQLLYNEGSTVIEQATVNVGDIETHRYIVETTLRSASTNEVIWHAFEMIYALPAPDGETIAGVMVSTQTQDELEPLVPVAEHMVESLHWGGE